MTRPSPADDLVLARRLLDQGRTAEAEALLRRLPEAAASPAGRVLLARAALPPCRDEALADLVTHLAHGRAQAAAPHPPLSRRAFLLAGCGLGALLGLAALRLAFRSSSAPAMSAQRGVVDLLDEARSKDPDLMETEGIVPFPRGLEPPAAGNAVASHALVAQGGALRWRNVAPSRRSLALLAWPLLPGLSLRISINTFPLRRFEAMPLGQALQARIGMALAASPHALRLELTPASGQTAPPPDAPALALAVLRFIPV